MTIPPVIDLSHWNPTPDWHAVRAAGVLGCIHKATEGTGYSDPTLYGRARGAWDAGLLWSTYHFLRPGDMKRQMDWYLEIVNPRQGERMCLDHEDMHVDLDELVNAVEYLHQVRPDVQITVYSGHLIKEQLGNTLEPTLADLTSLWIAHYTTPENLTWPQTTWPNWALWQYTDKQTIPGISAPVDGDRWNGSKANLVKWFGPAPEWA